MSRLVGAVLGLIALLGFAFGKLELDQWVTEESERHPAVAITCGAIFGTLVLILLLFWAVTWLADVIRRGIRSFPATSAMALTRLAIIIAGRKRAWVDEAWRGDLERPHDTTEPSNQPRRRQIRYAAGLVQAAIWYRLDDLLCLSWRIGDGILASRAWSGMVLIAPPALAATWVVTRDGWYGLIQNAENLASIGGLSVALIVGGRKARKIAPRSRRKDPAGANRQYR